MMIHLDFFVICIGLWGVSLDWSNPVRVGLARWLVGAWRVTFPGGWFIARHLNFLGFHLCLARSRSRPIGVRSDPEPKI